MQYHPAVDYQSDEQCFLQHWNIVQNTVYTVSFNIKIASTGYPIWRLSQNRTRILAYMTQISLDLSMSF